MRIEWSNSMSWLDGELNIHTSSDGKIMFIRKMFLIGFLFFSTSVFSQGTEQADTGSHSEGVNNSIQTIDRAIPIAVQVSDAAIQKRLSGILLSVGHFKSLDVKVVDGVVTLEGSTQNKDSVGWADSVSKNMDGVIGIVNNIDYTVPNVFSTKLIRKESESLIRKGVAVLPLLLAAVIVFAVFFFLASPVAGILMRPIGLMTQSELIRMVAKRIITIFIMLIGFYFFLRIAGLTQFALAVISGTGVIGLILGFAFKDIAENFISSLLISAQRPFRLGDVIQVEGHKGVVRKVTARGTTLVDFDGNHIQIPNAIIYKSILHNFSANPKLRGSFRIGIGYDASITLAQKIGMNLLFENEAVLNDPEPQVLVDSLGSSTVNLIVYYWVDGEVYAVNKVSSMLMRSTMRAFEKGGISMPDDAREIIFPQGVPVQLNNDKSAANEVPSTAPITSIKEIQNEPAQPQFVEEVDHQESLSSDTDDIKQQAAAARDPEEGKNII